MNIHIAGPTRLSPLPAAATEETVDAGDGVEGKGEHAPDPEQRPGEPADDVEEELAEAEGAAPDHAMTYVALQEATDGQAVAFGARVTDAEYRKGPPTA